MIYLYLKLFTPKLRHYPIKEGDVIQASGSVT